MTERMQREACIPARAGKQVVHGLVGESVGFAEHVLARLNSLSFTKTCRARELSGTLLVSPGLANAALTVSWLGRISTPGQRQCFRRNANPALSSNHDHVLATTRAPASTRRCLCRSISKEEIWLSNFPAKDSES
jgi:hypothetical protein